MKNQVGFKWCSIDTIKNGLSTNKQDTLLISFINSIGVKKIPCLYQKKSFNRGFIVEYAIKRLYAINTKIELNCNADMLLEGKYYEIKYIGLNACSSGSKEHHKNKHIVVFNNGSEIRIAIIDFNELIVDKNGHINYKNNHNKGKTILTYKS